MQQNDAQELLDCLPHGSLYSRLPRQFCFEQTDRLPDFLNHKRTTRRLRRAKVKPRFYHVEL
jgi:hypothetical protein